MDVFDLAAKITLDTRSYDEGLDHAVGQMVGFNKRLSGLGDLITSALGIIAKVGVAAVGAASAAVVGFGKSAIEAGLSFDAAMGQVQATAGVTTAEMENMVGSVDTSFGRFTGTLREFAQFMGSNTAFSATQAAQALNYMALAGYDTQQSMEMLPTVLNMAAAGSMDLALASDMITDTQSALGLSFERTAYMVDEFAKAASTGNTSVQQLGDAFLVVGGLAKETNGGFVTLADGTETAVDNVTELEIAFTAMANAGIKGSEAGTHMRNMLMKLSSPTSEGAKALEAMGVAIFDDAGHMRSLRDVFGELNDALGQMTQQDKIKTIAELFNARDLSSAEALLAAVGQDWDQIGESILDAQGAAQQMADTQLDNLQGDITIFKSALEGAQIAISDGLTPTFRDFVKFGSDGLSRLTEGFKEGGLSGAMDVFSDLLTDGIGIILDKVPDITKAGIHLLSAFIKGFTQNKAKLAQAGKQIISAITSTLASEFPQLKSFFDRLQSVIDGVFGFIERNGSTIKSVIKGILAGFLAYKTVISILQGVQTGIMAVTTVAKLLNGELALTAMINPFGAIALGVGGLVGLMVTLVDLEAQENEEYRESMTTISEATKEKGEAARQYLDQLKGIYDANQSVTRSVQDQYKEELALKDELSQIVDENGEIKEGYEERADVIMQQLNEAFDLELEKQGNVITNYDAEMDKIDQLIEKKKAEALINANQEQYTEALKKRLEYFNNMKDVQAEYNEVYAAYTESLSAAFDAQDKLNKAEANGSPSAATYGKVLQENVETMTFAKEKLAELKTHLDDTQKAYYANQDFINDYNSLLEATEKGTENLADAVVNMTDGIIEAAPQDILKQQAEETVTYLDDLLKAQSEGVTITETEITEATERVEKALSALKDSSAEWGGDMMDNFIGGIRVKRGELTKEVEDIAETISKRIGFSVPEEGALSDFDTYAPDMMRLFAQGIAQNEGMLRDQLDKSFDFSDVITAPTADAMSAGQDSAGVTQTGRDGAATGQNLTVILELDRTRLAQTVFQLNKEEQQRVGLSFA